MREQSRSAAPTGVLALVAALALLVGACNTDREITKPKPLPVTSSLLDASLLTVDDLPPGWGAAEGAGSPISAEIVEGHDCDAGVTKLTPKATASTDFSATGMSLTDTAAWFPGQGPAAERVYRDLAEKCRSVVLADRGESVRAGALNFGVLSDNTVAIRIEVEPANGVIDERDLIIMRKGDLIHVIRLVGPRPSDKALLDRVVRIAIGRLGLLHEDTT